MFKEIVSGVAEAIGIGGEPDIDRDTAIDFISSSNNVLSGTHVLADQIGVMHSDHLYEIAGELNSFGMDMSCSNAEDVIEAIHDSSKSLADAMDEYGVGAQDFPSTLENPTLAGYHEHLSQSFMNAVTELQEASPSCDLSESIESLETNGMTLGL